MKIADGIYLLDGADPDCNVYAIDNELLVDCGSGFFLEETLDQMKQYGLTYSGFRLIALTHAHFAHCGAIKEFKKKTKAKVAIHEEELKALETGDGVFHADEGEGIDYEGVKPDLLLNEGETIKTDNYEFEVIHSPGHSPGSVCLWEPEERILISGDLLFLDGAGEPVPSTNKKDLRESLKKIRELGEIDMLLPGHGAPGNRKNPYTGDAIDKALEAVE